MLSDFSRSEATGVSGTSGDLRLGDSTLKLPADVEKLWVWRERKSDRTQNINIPNKMRKTSVVQSKNDDFVFIFLVGLALFWQLFINFMIFGQLPGRSPQGKSRSIIKSLNLTPVYHMSCLQLSKVKLHYDDVTYQNSNIEKIIIIGRIIHFDKGTSTRGMAMINIKIEDSTGRASIAFYYSQEIENLCKQGMDYLKIGCHIKCAGMVYKPQIRIMGLSITYLTNFNQLTSHYLQCIRTDQKTQ